MTQDEADTIIAEFLEATPGWCRRAKRAEKATGAHSCLICGCSSDSMLKLCEAIKLKIKS